MKRKYIKLEKIIKNKIIAIIVKALVTIMLFFIIIYVSSPLYLGFLDKRINKVENKPPYQVSKSIKKLHSSLFIVDLHADSLFSYRNLLKKSTSGHVDIPRLIEGNIALQIFGVPTKISLTSNIEGNHGRGDVLGFLAFLQHWPIDTWCSPKNRAFHQSKKLHKFMIKSKGSFEVIKTSNQLAKYYKRRKVETNITAGILALEGAHIIDKDINNIDILHEKGFRIIGLTHFLDNYVGGSAHGVEKEGLTEFGEKVIKRMEELNIIVDLTHASPKLIDDVLDISSYPIMVSHTGVKGCVNNNRNLSDEQIKKIANKGGVIGIGFWETAVGQAKAKSIVSSILYVIDLVGIEHVSLGSDFDGSICAAFDTTGVVEITEALVEQGLSEEEIRLIMGENSLRFFLRNLPKD